MSDQYERFHQLTTSEELFVSRSNSCHIVNIKTRKEVNDQGKTIYYLHRRPQYNGKLKQG